MKRVISFNNQISLFAISYVILGLISCGYSGPLEVNINDPLLIENMGSMQYDGKVFTGVIKRERNGIVIQEHTYQQGRQAGTQKTYHMNSKLATITNLVNAQQHGVYKEYYPSGELHIEAIFDKDSIIAKRILDPEGRTVANYVIKGGRYFGLLGSKECISVINEEN